MIILREKEFSDHKKETRRKVISGACIAAGTVGLGLLARKRILDKRAIKEEMNSCKKRAVDYIRKAKKLS